MIVKRDCIYTPKGKNRPLHIYLPDDYYVSGQFYPVMYFFDGRNLLHGENAVHAGFEYHSIGRKSLYPSPN